MSKGRFYLCEHCKNLVGMIHNSSVPIMCCGEKMKELVANETDGAKEKHLPVVKINGDRVDVKVGDLPHPADDDHYIEWIYLQTDKGGQRKSLCPHEEPSVSFSLCDETVVAVYAYCNKHGLWRTVI